jgi:hypothetical protein
VICDFCPCSSLYECWFRVRCPFTGESIKIELHHVCRECAKLSIPYEEYGEKAFDIKEENNYQI